LLHPGCPPVPAIGTTTTISFDSDHSLGLFTEITGLVSFAPGSTGLILSIAKGNDTPTIQLSKYIFSGRVDVVMRAALGASIVTSFAMQPGTLDEIAFELVGVDGSQTQTNYFSKGCNHTYDRSGSDTLPQVTALTQSSGPLSASTG